MSWTLPVKHLCNTPYERGTRTSSTGFSAHWTKIRTCSRNLASSELFALRSNVSRPTRRTMSRIVRFYCVRFAGFIKAILGPGFLRTSANFAE
jgi:hypothetical protein